MNSAEPPETLQVTLSRVLDLAAVGESWRQLQDLVVCSFFQSWTWTGCLAEERFPDPYLLQAFRAGRVVAMGFFNRRSSWLGPDRLWLGESGSPEIDNIFIEHNGLLLDRSVNQSVLQQCLKAAIFARRRPRWQGFGRRVLLSGVAADHLQAAGAVGRVRVRATRRAPFVDCANIREQRHSYLETLSANTRYQLRRSAQKYRTRGTLAICRAANTATAHEFLASLVVLHQRSWQRRGKPGVFANPAFLLFHQRLIERGMPEQQIDLLRISAGDAAIGYLYNFRFRNRILAYQSGFDYDGAGPHQKPGLTSHHLAIDMYIAEGIDRYDFLAGGDRYKESLSNGSTELYWLELSARSSVCRILNRTAPDDERLL